MKKILFLFLVIISLQSNAQYAFELKVDYSVRIKNDDHFSVSGILTSGRIEKGKKYFVGNGTEIEVTNIMSAKNGAAVPVASAPEMVALAITCKGYNIERGDVLQGVNTKSALYANTGSYSASKMKEGELSCKLNGRVYYSTTVSKPVLIRQSDVLDLFFQAEDKSVIWLQLNNFSEIKNLPHTAKSDTSVKERVNVCKIAYLPNGYNPAEANNYLGFEDFNGNAGIIITYLDRYAKKMAFTFGGILRPNAKKLEDNPNAGLFYITDGKVDNIGWDAF